MQKLRIQTGNRLCAAFRSKLGLESSQREESDEDAQLVLDQIRASYKKLTDGVKKELPDKRTFAGDSVISDYSELCLVHQYMQLDSQEASHFRRIESIIIDHPLWTKFLEGVRGCGPAMAAVVITGFDISKAQYCSSLWKYAGYSVEEDGRATGRYTEHLRDIEYTDSKGKPATRKGLKYDPWLRSKLYVLATCMIKLGGKYRDIYAGYKNRLENHPKWADKTKMHRHLAAIRYMMKRFLVDLYINWRPLEGLPVHEEYSIAKLGMIHRKEAA